MSAARDTERDAFEAWAQKRLGLDVTRCAPPEEGFYVDGTTMSAWMAWSARADKAQAPAPLAGDLVKRIVYEHTKLNPNQRDDQELLGYIVNAVRAIERAHGIGAAGV